MSDGFQVDFRSWGGAVNMSHVIAKRGFMVKASLVLTSSVRDSFLIPDLDLNLSTFHHPMPLC